MTIGKKKQEALRVRMGDLGVYEEDLIERFILGSGKGGQKLNKSSSCVYLKHLPTQTEVKCQRGRSREINRFYARRDLCDHIAEKFHGRETERTLKAEKIRRQKKRRSRRSQKNKCEGGSSSRHRDVES